MSTVVLAILEGEDPKEARRKYLAQERRLEVMNVPFFPNVDVTEDGRVVRVTARDFD